MIPQHQVSELVAINGTKLRPNLRPKSQPKLRSESGPSWDQEGTKSDPSGDQVLFQPPTQSHKIFLPNYYTRFVTGQVGKQVHATNHREHRDFAAEVKSTAKVTARVTAKVTTYQGASKT